MPSKSKFIRSRIKHVLFIFTDFKNLHILNFRQFAKIELSYLNSFNFRFDTNLLKSATISTKPKWTNNVTFVIFAVLFLFFQKFMENFDFKEIRVLPLQLYFDDKKMENENDEKNIFNKIFSKIASEARIASEATQSAIKKVLSKHKNPIACSVNVREINEK
ncbi:hypothetical protein BpHYR1_002526 [Brachionus plicatilis]|uniref:Uncharacterized protein n=1 Tax=Brachionus plicatilis TaxID=10195 RepID=A0A3M7SQP4_BRAPC|nr:hypothetical protein BpHYR1_002526 [Brachionus plicatilis]